MFFSKILTDRPTGLAFTNSATAFIASCLSFCCMADGVVGVIKSARCAGLSKAFEMSLLAITVGSFERSNVSCSIPGKRKS